MIFNNNNNIEGRKSIISNILSMGWDIPRNACNE